MTMISNVLVIAKIYSKWLLRRPLTYFFIAIFMPISIMVPMLLLVSPCDWTDVIAGAILFSVIGGGIADVTLNVSFDRETRRTSFFISRGIAPIEYMLGIIMGGASYTFVGAIVILFFGYALLGFEMTALQILGILGVIMVAWVTSANVGFILSLYGPRDHRLAASVADVLLFTLAFLAPVYYPIEMLPTTLRWASYSLYTTHLGIIAKSIIRGESIQIASLIFLAAFAGVLFFASTRGMRWKRGI